MKILLNEESGLGMAREKRHEIIVRDVCLQRIRRKLSGKDHDPSSPIQSVRGVGYRIRAESAQ